VIAGIIDKMCFQTLTLLLEKIEETGQDWEGRRPDERLLP
jgi:hypothetical protein